MVTAGTISTIGWTIGKVALSTVGGATLGGTLFGVAGGYVGFNLGKSNDPCKDGQMLTALAGTIIGSYSGAYIGGFIGLTGAASGLNLLSAPFKPIVNGIANIVGNNGIAGYIGSTGNTVLSGASHLGSIAATAAKSAIIYNQVTIGVAITTAIIGYTAYSLYKKATPEQKEQVYEAVTGIFQSKLAKEEKLLAHRFEAFEAILAKASGNKEAQAANDALIKEYSINGDIKIDTVIKVRNSYQESLKDLDNNTLQEISSKSSALMLSIAKCSRLKENEQSKQAGRVY